MTLSSLDKFINNYILFLGETKQIKDISRIYTNIEHSKKSESIYVRFYFTVCKQPFKSISCTIRFSDHEYVTKKDSKIKYKQILLEPGIEISSRNKKYIKRTIKRAIKNLMYSTYMPEIYSFKANSI